LDSRDGKDSERYVLNHGGKRRKEGVMTEGKLGKLVDRKQVGDD